MSMNSSDPFAGLIPPPAEVDDTHKVYSIAAACIVLCLISCAMVITRLVLKIWKADWGADDYAIIPATALYVGWSALAVYINLNAGVGKPLWEITIDEFSLWFKGIVVAMWLYPLMSAAIRVSTLLFYKRIFGTANPEMLTTIWVLLILQVVYVVVFSITPAFVCKPFYHAWQPLTHRFYCNDLYYYESQVGLYSVSMTFDVVLLVLPIVPVLRLRLSIWKRIGVSVIFALGAAASIAAAYKLGVFVDQQRFYIPTNLIWLQHLMSRFVPGQFDAYGVTFWIPSQVEPTVALIGTSMPAVRKLFRHFWGQMSTRRSKGGSSSDQSGSNNSRSLPQNSEPQRSTRSLLGRREPIYDEMLLGDLQPETARSTHARADSVP